MDEWSIVLKLCLALLLGALIGIERESTYQEKQAGSLSAVEKIGGLRTYALIALLGGIGGVVLANHPPFFYLLFGGVILLIVTSYLSNVFLYKASGLTTEFSGLFAFVIGALITAQAFLLKEIIAGTIIVTLLLSRKRTIEGAIQGLHKNEILNLLSFAIVALVVLPFLPDKGIVLTDVPYLKNLVLAFNLPATQLAAVEIFNPFRIWLIVVLVSGIHLFSYYLFKYLAPEKGIILTAVTGGLISSTTSTQILAVKSNNVFSKAETLELSGAALLSNAASFVKILILVLPLNPLLFVKSFYPILALILSTTAVSLILFRQARRHHQPKTSGKLSSLFKHKAYSLGPALKFALLLIAIQVFIRLVLVFFGNFAFYLASVLSALGTADIVIINLAEMTGDKITLTLSLFSLLTVITVNLIGKFLYSVFKGKPDFSQWVGIGLAIGIVSMALTTILLP